MSDAENYLVFIDALKAENADIHSDLDTAIQHNAELQQENAALKRQCDKFKLLARQRWNDGLLQGRTDAKRYCEDAAKAKDEYLAENEKLTNMLLEVEAERDELLIALETASALSLLTAKASRNIESITAERDALRDRLNQYERFLNPKFEGIETLSFSLVSYRLSEVMPRCELSDYIEMAVSEIRQLEKYCAKLQANIKNGIRAFAFKDTSKIANVDAEGFGHRCGSNATLILDEGVNLDA